MEEKVQSEILEAPTEEEKDVCSAGRGQSELWVYVLFLQGHYSWHLRWLFTYHLLLITHESTIRTPRVVGNHQLTINHKSIILAINH